MPSPHDSTGLPTDWRADNPAHLRRIWADLHPESDEAGTERKFGDVSLSLRQAGDVFERWVLEAFRLSGTSGHYAFRVPLGNSGNTREQIDGMILDGWQGFLVESKFWTDKVDFSPLAVLHYLVETRPVGTLGLFFSAFGYTSAAFESTEILRPLRVLLFDQRDLDWALRPGKFQGRMAEMVRQKWLLALKYGRSNLLVSEVIELFP